jgi:hypothetical protein
VPDLDKEGTRAATLARSFVAGERLARVAMTRGWNAARDHLAYRGLALQIGIGIYRVVTAKDTCKRVQAVAGTGAGIGGGLGGAALGATVGTFILPGAGTVIGGLMGSVGGGAAAQIATEKITGSTYNMFTPDLCPYCAP